MTTFPTPPHLLSALDTNLHKRTIQSCAFVPEKCLRSPPCALHQPTNALRTAPGSGLPYERTCAQIINYETTSSLGGAVMLLIML